MSSPTQLTFNTQNLASPPSTGLTASTLGASPGRRRHPPQWRTALLGLAALLMPLAGSAWAVNVLTANPASVSFNGVAGGAATAAIPVSITSSPSGSTYTATSNQTWLTVSPTSNATGGVTSVNLTANPASLSAGVYSATVSFAASGFTTVATQVTFTVNNPSGVLTQVSGTPFGTLGSTTNPSWVAAGDLNGDGIPDIVTANRNANTVSAWLGTGTGTFTAATGSPYSVGSYPKAVAVADFTGDGILDIVSVNRDSGNISILKGSATNKTGAFGFTALTAVAVTPSALLESITVTDFDGDGKLDIAIGNDLTISGSPTTGSIAVLKGNGTGGFTAMSGSPFATGPEPWTVVAGDFNGDGKPDLLSTNAGSNTVTFLAGTGTSFSAGVSFTVGSGPIFAAVGDFNADGKLDAAVLNRNTDNVTVLLGNGAGSFSAASGSPFAVGDSPVSLAAGDLNGDGKLDLVSTNGNATTMSVLLGTGTGSFQSAPGSPITLGGGPIFVRLVDLNGDGRLDLVTPYNGNSMAAFLGGTATTTSTLTTTAASTIVYGTAVPLTLTVAAPANSLSSPSGTATFFDTPGSIGTASQSASPYTFSAAALGGGAHVLTATYNGDGWNAASTSAAINITVNKATPMVSATGNTCTYSGASCAGSGSATGVLTGPDVLSPVTLSYTGTGYGPTATAPTSAGTYSVTATFAGDANYNSVTSAPATITINKATPTVSATGNTCAFSGAPCAGSGSATGVLAGPDVLTPVTLSYSGAGYGPTATPPTSGGTYSLTATFAGDANYNSVTSAPATITIGKVTPTVSATGNTCTYSGAPCAGSGSATGILAGPDVLTPVTLSYTGSGYGPTATAPTNAGTYSVTATFAGDANYNSGTAAPATITINKAASTVSVTGNTCTYSGSGCAGSGSATGVLAGPDALTPVTLSYSGSGYGPGPTAPVNAGTYSVTATFAGNANYNGGTSAPATITINPASATVQVTSLTVAFDGSPKPVTVTTLPAGISTSVTYNGSATVPSAIAAYNVVATITDPNYTAAPATGTLNITGATGTPLLTALIASKVNGTLTNERIWTLQVSNTGSAAITNVRVASVQILSVNPTTATVTLGSTVYPAPVANPALNPGQSSTVPVSVIFPASPTARIQFRINLAGDNGYTNSVTLSNVTR